VKNGEGGPKQAWNPATRNQVQRAPGQRPRTTTGQRATAREPPSPRTQVGARGSERATVLALLGERTSVHSPVSMGRRPGQASLTSSWASLVARRRNADRLLGAGPRDVREPRRTRRTPTRRAPPLQRDVQRSPHPSGCRGSGAAARSIRQAGLFGGRLGRSHAGWWPCGPLGVGDHPHSQGETGQGPDRGGGAERKGTPCGSGRGGSGHGSNASEPRGKAPPGSRIPTTTDQSAVGQGEPGVDGERRNATASPPGGERSREATSVGRAGTGSGKWILRAGSAEGDPNLTEGRPPTHRSGSIGGRTDRRRKTDPRGRVQGHERRKTGSVSGQGSCGWEHAMVHLAKGVGGATRPQQWLPLAVIL